MSTSKKPFGYVRKYGPALWKGLRAAREAPTRGPAPVAKEKPRKWIRAMSKPMASRRRVYALAVTEWKALPENRFCKFPGCTCPTEDNHHICGRSGPLLMDRRWWLPVCRAHHNWIRDHPNAAKAMGLLTKGPWNTVPRDDTPSAALPEGGDPANVGVHPVARDAVGVGAGGGAGDGAERGPEAVVGGNGQDQERGRGEVRATPPGGGIAVAAVREAAAEEGGL